MMIKDGNRQRPCVQLGMTDQDVVERVARLLGVSVYQYNWAKRPSQKPMFWAKTSGSCAAELMRLLLPLMGARRSTKIEELLQAGRGAST